jgi:hypothetical protein
MEMVDKKELVIYLDRQDLLSLIKNVRIPMGGNQYSKFTGDQWNPNWSWDDKKLQEATNDELWRMYQEAKNKGDLIIRDIK